MRKAQVLAAAWLAATTLVFLSPAEAGVDVPIDGDANVQNEISLTLVPGQPGKVVMAYNDNPYAPTCPGLGIAHRQSSAGSWTTTQLALPIMGALPGMPKMARAFDPTVTADLAGNVYAAFIADGATPGLGTGDSGLFVSVSLAGSYGQAWNPPVQVAYNPPPTAIPDPLYRFNDRCQITADTVSGSIYAGSVYVTWIKDRGYNQPPQPWGDIYFAYSTNQAVTWNYPTPHPVTFEALINDNPGGDMANMPVPAVAADGTVYVSWLDYNVMTGGQGTIHIDKSTDGGANWGTDTKVRTINLPPLRVSRADGTLDALAKGAPVLAASPTNANELYITYAADPNPADGDEADIFLIKSINGGANWAAPVKVNHDDTTSGDNILPWIDVKPNGTIDVAWYDRRNDPLDILWDVYIARSTDGGASFSANVQVNDTSFATPTNGWLGEYLGLAVDGSDAYLAFTSSVTDLVLGDVYFDSIANASIPEPGTLLLLTCAAAAMAPLRKRRAASHPDPD